MTNIFLAIYLCVINAIAYAAYASDKRRAIQREPRIPEATLLALGFLGGNAAAFYAQRKLRHKNRKLSFQIKFWLLVAVQIAIIIVIASDSEAIQL